MRNEQVVEIIKEQLDEATETITDQFIQIRAILERHEERLNGHDVDIATITAGGCKNPDNHNKALEIVKSMAVQLITALLTLLAAFAGVRLGKL